MISQPLGLFTKADPFKRIFFGFPALVLKLNFFPVVHNEHFLFT